MNFSRKDKAIVFDGNFEAQLYRYLDEAEKRDPTFALRALNNKKIAVYCTHQNYLRAGAQIIRTNTYRASIDTFSHKLGFPASEYVPFLQKAVKLAKEAVQKFHESTDDDGNDLEYYRRQRALIAGSCGSYRAAQFDNKYNIWRDVEEVPSHILQDFHEQRIRVLLESGVDLLAFESISSRKETEVIMKVLERYPTARSWITFLCMGDGKLMDKSDFTKIVTLCYHKSHKQIFAVGAECCEMAKLKIWMQKINYNTNSNIPYVLYFNKSVLSPKATVDLSVHHMQQWLNLGVRYIGGSFDTVAENVNVIREQTYNCWVSTIRASITPFNSHYFMSTLY